MNYINIHTYIHAYHWKCNMKPYNKMSKWKQYSGCLWHPLRMWGLAFTLYANNVTSTTKIWLPYSLSFLCQIVPELCKLGNNLNPYPCGIIASLQNVNNHSLFQDMTPLVTTVKYRKLLLWQVREAELETKGMSTIHNQTQ